MHGSNEISGGPASGLDEDSREKTGLMERIIKHVFDDTPCDTENLWKILESLQDADGRPPDSSTADDMDNSEEMSVADQEFTVKPLSNNTSRWSN